MKKLNKKGGIFENLGSLGIGIATLAITLVVVFLIISQGRTQIVDIDDINVSNISSYSAGYNSTVTLASAVDDIPAWIPLIVIAAIGAILIGMVKMFRTS